MRAFLLIALAVALIGCGSGNPYDPIQVSGKVVYEDGSPIPVQSMRLVFQPQAPPVDANTHPRKGIADVGADGTFDVVTTYKYGDGLIPGKQKVTVFASEGTVRGTDIASTKVPKEYSNGATTPLIVDTADTPLEIKIRKP